MKTFSLRREDVEKKWILIDASGLIVGRIASEIAKMLRGKDEAFFTPHIDCGKNIVVINADKVRFTGNKTHTVTGKCYYYHTGFAGGIKKLMAGKILEGRFPERILKMAIKRMLPKNKIARHQLANLYVYAGQDHPHQAQQPQALDLAARNSKNIAK